jgi:hypothetical protein
LRRVRSRRETLTQPRWIRRLIYQFTLPTAIPKRADRFACVTLESCAISFRRAYSCCLISVMFQNSVSEFSHGSHPLSRTPAGLIMQYSSSPTEEYIPRMNYPPGVFPVRATAPGKYSPFDRRSLPGTRSSVPAAPEWFE